MTTHDDLIAEAREMDAGVLVTKYNSEARVFVKEPSIVAKLADALESTLAERDAALAVIEEVRKHVEGDWRAEHIERILSSVPVDALSEHDRQVAERAWDEGHRHCFHVEDPNNPIKGNPYRKGASDE